MPKRSSKPRDVNALARAIVDEATGERLLVQPGEGRKKNSAAVELGRLGGKRGGPARAASLSHKQRQAIARKAAKARWSKKGRNAQE